MFVNAIFKGEICMGNMMLIMNQNPMDLGKKDIQLPAIT